MSKLKMKNIYTFNKRLLTLMNMQTKNPNIQNSELSPKKTVL